jgi:small-conductance mechanosensitive channel
MISMSPVLAIRGSGGRLPEAVDAETLSETTIDPVMAILALVVLLLAWILSRWARRATARVLSRLEGITPEMKGLLARVVGYFVLFLGIGIALSLLGAPVQPLLAAAIVIGVVLALAMRGIAENFAAGILLQTRRPIHVGDEIESLGHSGNVVEMNGRAVVVETFDGRLAHLPNSEVLGEPLLNHTEHGARRSEVEVRVRSHDLDAVTEWLHETVGSTSGVMADPAPVVYLTGVDPVRVTALVQFWHDPANGYAVRSAVIEALARAGKDRTEIATLVTPPPSQALAPTPWL